MSYMYGGNILRVDLSKGKISREPTAPYAADFLGGRGINIKILYDEVPPEVAPLDPANRLIFGVGPLCGTPVPASRVEVTAKSPETGFLGASNFGGFFGPELKYAGYDNIVITGKSDKPVYLWIYNDEVEIRDAGHLWGKDTYQTQDIIRSELGPDFKIACIGQAGENLVHFATIQAELKHGSGRTGMGAVMGSKNLKAIVVRGTKGVSLADPEKYLTIAGEVERKLRNHPAAQEKQKHGSSLWLDNKLKRAAEGQVPRPSFASDAFLKYQSQIQRTGCFGCPVQCMDLYPVEAKGGGAISCTFYISPFYEVGNTDIDSMLEYSFLAQRYGIDIATAMKIIALLMMLSRDGIITTRDTDGIPMEWGSREAILGMLEKTVQREGIGNILADGMLPTVEKIGQGAKDYAYTMKGLPLYDRFTPEELVMEKGEAFAITMSSRGDNMKVRTGGLEEVEVIEQSMKFPDAKSAAQYIKAAKEKVKRVTGTDKAFLPDEYEGKAALVAYMEEAVIIGDSLSACKFCGSFLNYPFQESDYAALFSAGTGLETSEETLFEFARKVKNLERAYNVREGMTRKADSLPKKFMDQPVTYTRFDYQDVNNIRKVQQTAILKTDKFEKMKDEYYVLRGWDIASGVPTQETLEQNGLSHVAQDLAERGKLPEKVPAGRK
ncbi:aldehyde ferredoxin oxidoreductase family protein [Chloroflexota bacterium]